MKDYSAMSDFEINKAVAISIGGFYEEDMFEPEQTIFRRFIRPDRKTYAEFNPCNNPADAWPIIISNGISLGPAYFNDEWLAAKFKPTRDNSKPHEIETYSSGRPLRAAMIVYLQMMEAKE